MATKFLKNVKVRLLLCHCVLICTSTLAIADKVIEVRCTVRIALEAEGFGASLQHDGSYLDTSGSGLTKGFGSLPSRR